MRRVVTIDKCRMFDLRRVEMSESMAIRMFDLRRVVMSESVAKDCMR